MNLANKLTAVMAEIEYHFSLIFVINIYIIVSYLQALL